MKLVLTTSAPELDAELDPRFGRGAYLLIINTDTHQWEALTNPGVNAPGGAGIKAAQYIVNLKVDAAISGDFGPHAFDALQAGGVAMYLYGDCPSVRDAIERFKAGQLEQVGAPTRGDCHNGKGA
jgi:predicted Fe-Mo cluster-binding NifX family protein